MISKKTLFSLLFMLVAFPFVQGQDLITNTRNNVPSNARGATPSEINKWIKEDIPLIQSSTPIDLFELTPESSQRSNQLKNDVSDLVLLDVNQSLLNDFNEAQYSHISLKVPVTEKNHFELYLKRVDISNGAFVLSTSKGETVHGEVPGGLFYRGYIKGNPDSWVALSVFEDEVRALITDNRGDYVLAQLKTDDGYVLYNDENLKIESDFVCQVDESFEITLSNLTEETGNPATSRSAVGECLDVFIEVDYYTYSNVNNGFANNLTNTRNWATAVFNEVATLYANDGFSIQISEVKVNTSSAGDFSVGLGGTIDVLYAFSQLMQTNGFNGDYAHWVSTRGLGGGVAWLNTMCREGNFIDNNTGIRRYWGPYAVSASMSTNITTLPTFSWNVEVFAHEMGHNWSNPHTHNCGWGTVADPRPFSGGGPIDCCGHNAGYPEDNCASCTVGEPTAAGGTIMSYCHLTNTGINFNNGFHPIVKSLMTTAYANAACSDPCPVDDSCSDNAVTVNSASTSGDVGSKVSITTSGNVAVSGNANFTAPTITLNNGFVVASGNTFTATAAACASTGASQGQGTNVPDIPQVDPVGTKIQTPLDDFLTVTPNPSRGLTNIEYELGQEGITTLQIFDVSGLLIETLVNNQNQTKGFHKIEYTPKTTDSGLFYVVIKTEEGIHTKKMILLK